MTTATKSARDALVDDLAQLADQHVERLAEPRQILEAAEAVAAQATAALKAASSVVQAARRALSLESSRCEGERTAVEDALRGMAPESIGELGNWCRVRLDELQGWSSGQKSIALAQEQSLAAHGALQQMAVLELLADDALAVRIAELRTAIGPAGGARA